MDKPTRNPRKLNLNRQTVRTLHGAQLKQAAGGGGAHITGNICQKSFVWYCTWFCVQAGEG